MRARRRLWPLMAVLFVLLSTIGSHVEAAEPAAAVSVELISTNRLNVVSGYVRIEEGAAIVRGLVRRPTLYKGSIGGHLDVVALGADGQTLETVQGGWRGTLGGDHAAAAAYAVGLATKPEDIARVVVKHCYDAH